MKKTAVQNLIDYLEKTYIFVEGGQTRQEFKKALEEEEDNLVKAFDEGSFSNERTNGHGYYSQTFKND